MAKNNNDTAGCFAVMLITILQIGGALIHLWTTFLCFIKIDSIHDSEIEASVTAGSIAKGILAFCTPILSELVLFFYLCLKTGFLGTSYQLVILLWLGLALALAIISLVKLND